MRPGVPHDERPRGLLRELVGAVISSVDAGPATRRALALEPISPGPVIALGKAGAAMAAAVAETDPERAGSCLVVVPRGTPLPHVLRVGRVIEADHPLPTERSVRAGESVRAAIAEARARSAPAVTLLVSGGASALACLPAGGLEAGEVAAVARALLRAGCPIGELNTVRKHVDLLKGGGVARLAWPVPVTSLVLSDVVGDDPATVGSGPGVPDPTTYQDALSVLDRYSCRGVAPGVDAHLVRGAAGMLPETLKPGAPAARAARVRLVASNDTAVEAACAWLATRGVRLESVRRGVTGEARRVGARLAADVRAAADDPAPAEIGGAWVLGGESTVTVRGSGRGGRNQELALAAALRLDGVPGAGVLALATDGVDSTPEAAGAIVTGRTAAAARAAGIDLAAALHENDSGSALGRLGCLVRTGPTGTNVCDLAVGLLIG
ncbi:MAG TPA: DUF4147 domain-containing protein [Phycisphaerales bacterium]|nr:DUF4147 domain-containing protein [Phycisphaerales bacterium]